MANATLYKVARSVDVRFPKHLEPEQGILDEEAGTFRTEDNRAYFVDPTEGEDFFIWGTKGLIGVVSLDIKEEK
jgi:hypothetical protein